MNSLQESYLKALKPTIAIKVTSLDKEAVPENIIAIINIALSKTKKTFVDIENGVIYVGKRV